MKYVIRQTAADAWSFMLVNAEGRPEYVSGVRYPTREAAEAVVLKLRGQDVRTPISFVPLSPFTRPVEAI